MKKLISICVVTVMLLSTTLTTFAASPSSKEEVVYGLLSADGKVNDVYVVNIFDGGEIIDYGNYTSVRNMTSTARISRDGDKLTASAEGKLYYQGTLENHDLPWNIDIEYELDGTEISGSELAGKNGALKIDVSVTQNENVDSTFFENYAVQVSFSLDNSLCENIVAEGATIAQVGGKKQLTFTGLPTKGVDFTVTADVHDFEMDAISINGIKLALGISVDDAGFTSQINNLIEAITQLDDGAAELLDGANKLLDGVTKYQASLKEFNDGMKNLSSGSEKLWNGATSLKKGITDLTAQNDNLVNGATALQQGVFDSVNKQLTAQNIGFPTLTPENYKAVLGDKEQLVSIKAQLDSAVQFTVGIKSYTSGVSSLGTGADGIISGSAELKTAISKLSTASNELYSAGTEINTATKKLREGLDSYNKGTNELRGQTSNMGSDVSAKTEEVLAGISGNGDPVVSFVSDKNLNVSAVQFVIKTETIKKPVVNAEASPQTVKLSFWQKLLRLFGL